MLADLGTFEICVSKYMSLILLIFIPPQDQMAGSFKKDLKKVDLLTYICDALLMVEKVSDHKRNLSIHLYAKANNKYLKNYDKSK